MKTCFKCLRILPLTGFYSHPRMKDGHLNKCISCTKADALARHHTTMSNPLLVVQKRRKARLRYLSTPVDRRPYRTTPPEVMRQYRKRYKDQNPEKVTAGHKVSNAIRDGRLFPQPCEVCGQVRTQAHHDDYSRPLDVRWLCQRHHAELHAERREHL